MIARGVEIGGSKRVNVMLRNSQVAYLKRVGAAIQENSAIGIGRSEIIRAMIDAVQSSDVDLSKVKTEEEMVALLTDRLKGGKKK